MKTFYHDWDVEDAQAHMLKDFEVGAEVLEGAEVLFAAYTYENYSGDAFVLFKKDGKLFEVNGGHCSCYGLEGQWDPEETNVPSIQKRLGTGYNFEGYATDLAYALGALEQELKA